MIRSIDSRRSREGGARPSRGFGVAVVPTALVSVVALATMTALAACSSAQGTPPSSVSKAGAPPPGSKRGSVTASTGRVHVEPRDGVVGVLTSQNPREIAPGQAVAVGGSLAVVGFERVVEDSRCARGTTCVWAGRARVEITLRKSPSGPDRLLELEVGSPDKGRIEVGDRKIVAAALTPYPEAKVPISAADYRLRLEIVEAGDTPPAKKR